jgi:hypothetical protein
MEFFPSAKGVKRLAEALKKNNHRDVGSSFFFFFKHCIFGFRLFVVLHITACNPSLHGH